MTAVNDAPVGVDDTGSAAEDSAATGNVLTNDTDVDNVLANFAVTQFTVTGDATVYAAGATATIAGKGTLVVNANGTYVFTPVEIGRAHV